MFRKKKDGEGEERDENPFRRPFDDPFFGGGMDDFFGDFSGIEKMMNDLMRNMFSGQGRAEPGKPFVYGFSMKTGPDGKPHISEFGNVKPGQIDVDGGRSIGPVVQDAREPLVDVMDSEKEIIVIAELPGVEKRDIDLEIDGDRLMIKVDTETKKYYKEVALPDKVKDDATDASYNNGVLEIHLKRKNEKTKGKKIQIK